MGRFKDIKENAPEWMKMSTMDVAEIMDPTAHKKYVQMITNLMKSKMTETVDRFKNNNEIQSIIHEIQFRLPHKPDYFFSNLSTENLIMLTRVMDMSPFSYSDIKDISEFIDRHSNNKFFSVDVNQIKEISEIQMHNSIASIKEIEKEMENQVVVVLNSENWLAVRPITYQSSLKYGATTKWCTASRDSYYHFFRYTESGTLVYVINKKTGEKTAMFAGYSPQSSMYEISFWNQVDDRIDSMMANLDNEIMDVLKNIIKYEGGSNKSLNDSMWLESRNMEDVRNGQHKSGEVPPRDIRMLVEEMDHEESLPQDMEIEMEELYNEAMEPTMNINERYATPTINYVDHMDNRGMRG
jgi:hypothetical protein